MNYKVTVCYVDFPMGASPEYTVRGNLTLEEANGIVKELQNNEEKNPNSSVYKVYSVREMK